MFSKLKQKIADGVEGVSPGRQTPLRGPTGELISRGKYKKMVEDSYTNDSSTFNAASLSKIRKSHQNASPQEVLARVQHLLEVGRAQAQNNGKIDESASPLSSSYSSPLHKQHDLQYNRRTSDVTEDDSCPLQESTPNQSFVAIEPVLLNDRRISVSSNTSAAVDERSDVESDMDSTLKLEQMNVHDLRVAFKKQNQTLKKYKQKFSELVSAYKSMQKDKEKLEGALSNGQDKQLQRIKELKETLELEKEGKRHMEEVLNLNLEEKDAQILALRTQVQLLKSPISEKSSNFKEEKNFTNEKHNNIQHDLVSKLAALQEELDKKDTIILQVREESAQLEISLREEILTEYKESVLSVGLKKQEEELRMLYAEKELQIKDTFANKVHDLQRILEENKKQRDLILSEKDQELQRQKELLRAAEQKLNNFLKKEEELRCKTDGFNTERIDYQKKIEELYLEIEQEKKVSQNLVKTFEEQMQEKQKEFSELLGKKKRLSETKVYEVKEQLRKKTQELTEVISSHKSELEIIVKDTKQQMQSEHSKIVRKLELKISDMKKVMKELRAQLEEKEMKCSDLSTNLLNAENEINLGKQLKLSSESLNTSLIESETKIKELNQSLRLKETQFQEEHSKQEFIKNEMIRMTQTIELMNIEQENKDSEILDWRCKSEEASQKIKHLYSQLSELQTAFENKSIELNEMIKSKDLHIEEISCKLEAVQKDLEDCVNELQVERRSNEVIKNSIKCIYAENEQLLQQVSIDQISSKKSLEENDILKKSNEFLTKEIESLKNSCDELKGVVIKLNLVVTAKSEEIEQLENSVLLLKNENVQACAELNKEIECLKDSNNWYEARIVDFKDEIEIMKKLQAKNEAYIEESNIEIESLKKNHENSFSQSEILKAEIDSLKRKCNQLEAEKSAINEELDTSKSLLSSYEGLIEQKEKEFRFQINNLMEDKNISVAHYSEKMEEARKASISELETRYKQKIEDLTKSFDTKVNIMHENFKNDKQTLITDYNSQLNKFEKKNENLQIQQSKRKEFLAKLTNDISKTNNWLDVLASTNDFNKIDLSYDNTDLEDTYLQSDDKHLLKQLVDAVKLNRNKIEELIDKKTTHYSNLILECSNEKMKLSREIELLSSELCKNKVIITEKELAIVELNKKLTDEMMIIGEQLQSLEAKYSESSRDLENSKSILTQKNVEIQFLNSQIESSKISLQEKEDLEKNNQYKYQISLLKGEIEKLESVNLSLLENVNNLQKDLFSKTKDIEELNNCYEKSFSSYNSEKEELIYNISALKDKNLALISDIDLLNIKLETELSNNQKNQEDLLSKINAGHATIAQLKLEILNCNSKNADLDEKVKSLSNEKSELHAMLKSNELEYNEKYQKLESDLMETKGHLERKVQEMEANSENMEALRKENLGELMLEVSKNNDLNKTKLLEMKQKAELKIKKMKRDFAEKNLQKEARIKELEALLFDSNAHSIKADSQEKKIEEANNMIMLLKEECTLEKLKFTEQLVESHSDELEATCKKFTEEINSLKKQLEKANVEVLFEKNCVLQLQENIEQMTIDKMAALKKQKLYLEEDHENELKKVLSEAQQKTEMVEKKLTAKIEEKDFEFNSKIKQMLKEFRLEQCQKDHDIEKAVQEAIEKAQCDERKIIMEYDEQITELQKELHLREDDLINFQNETNEKIAFLTENNSKLIEEHQVALQVMEAGFSEQLESLVKCHKEELQGLVEKTQEEMEVLFNQRIQVLIDEYESKLQKAHDSHHAEILAQEKKFKALTKKNKVEMRKLLTEKNELQNDSTTEKISILSKELISLREREKVLAMQVEENSPVSPDKFRPATLVLDQNLSNSQSPSPRTPQPIEFEYLRNILYQYMMGKQRTQMAKVLTAIVHFSPTQVKQILAKVEEQENQNIKKSSGWL